MGEVANTSALPRGRADAVILRVGIASLVAQKSIVFARRPWGPESMTGCQMEGDSLRHIEKYPLRVE